MTKVMCLALVGQSLATLIVVVISWVLSGAWAAWSAVLGGLVVMGGSLGFTLFGRNGLQPQNSPGQVLRIAIRAEAIKILVIVVLLWLAFHNIVGLAKVSFMSAFIVSTFFSVLGLVYNT